MQAPATKLLAHLSFWLATLAMLAMGWTLYAAVTNEIDSSRQVSRAQEVRQAAGEINELLSRAESAQRGYLLSGRKAFISERDPALEKLNDAVAQVRALTSFDPGQQLRISEIGKLIQVRIARMQESARLRLAGSIGTAQGRAAAGIGQAGSTRIHELVAELRQEELRRMKMLRADAESRHETELWALIAAVIFGILALIPGYLGFVMQTRARERTEKKLRVMADSLPGAMYQLTHPARGKAAFTFMSSGFTDVLGMDAAGAAGAPPDWDATVAAIDERDRPGFVAALAAARQSLAPFRHDYRVTHGDGTSRWLHHEASLQKEGDGSVLQNGYLSDITGQRRLEEALQEAKIAADSANRAKSAFLATMSHEIRTPMNGVLGMLELLSLTKLDAGQGSTLEIVRDSSRSLMRIIDDILDFSKIEAGKLEVFPEAASIREVIEGVRNIYSGNASSKGLLLTCGTDPQISPAVMVDPLRLRQILSNFVSNALKFTAQGSIGIRADLVERANGADRVRFSVQDTGIGISAEDQERVFQPFSQGKDAATRGVSGTGLGLTICRRLADMMGGTVAMASIPGKGTTMTLELSMPIAAPGEMPEAKREGTGDPMRAVAGKRRPAPAIADAELEGTLVLVVDDHPTNRALLLRQVQALGYAGKSAEDGAQALTMWESGRFGMVITDCNMPEMDGYELARSIRAREAGGGRRTPILACTAYALGGEAEICLAAGMDDYLGKPVGLSLLLKKLDQWLPIPEPKATTPGDSGESPNATPGAGPVDRSVLAAISNGDKAFEHEVLVRFRQSNVEDAAALERALAANDVSQVTRAAHRMLGACRMVGALGLAGACDRIGQASRTRDWQSVETGLAAFRLELARLNTYFDAIPESAQ